jgi:pyridoxine 5-phosphate synthase
MVRGAAACGADRVELYTAAYAEGYHRDRSDAIAPYIVAAIAAKEAGLGLNAGHDLNLDNLNHFIRTIPWTDEVSIGHAIICDALYMGLERTIAAYLEEIRKK